VTVVSQTTGTQQFQISPALATLFLPNRMAVLQGYLNNIPAAAAAGTAMCPFALPQQLQLTCPKPLVLPYNWFPVGPFWGSLEPAYQTTVSGSSPDGE